MAKADRGASNKSESERLPSTEEMSADSQVVTDAERKNLIEDAKAFRASHEQTFRLLSEGDNERRWTSSGWMPRRSRS